jgi:hypothetical protein
MKTKEEISLLLKESWLKRNDYHGMVGTKFYNSWRSIKTRCNGTCGKDSIKKYKDKGITYCKKWNNFKGFYEDMFNSYIEGLTIDRIDNSKGYFKENCRWATQKIQQNNKTNNVRINYKGVDKTLREWSDELGVTYDSIKLRYYRRYLTGKITIEQLIEFKK